MKGQINGETCSRMRLHDEPLCVLRYKAWKKLVYSTAILLLIPFALYGAFVYSPPSMAKLVYCKSVGLVFLTFLLIGLADIALFKEIRLYEDRIAKTWLLLGTRELELKKVGLRCVTIPELGMGKKTFFHETMRKRIWIPELGRLVGIYYMEHMARPSAVKELNTVLARLSGREPWELERTVAINSLIKEGLQDERLIV
jgi:hypothetical protein